MTEKTSFNGIPIPPELKLAETPEVPSQAQQQASAAGSSPAEPSKSKKRKSGAKSRRTKSGAKASAQARWNRIKDKFTQRLETVDQEILKRALLGFGLAVATVLAVLVAIKLMPAALTLLALLGLALAIQIWDRLRYRPMH
jgi:hypothetical protein